MNATSSYPPSQHGYADQHHMHPPLPQNYGYHYSQPQHHNPPLIHTHASSYNPHASAPPQYAAYPPHMSVPQQLPPVYTSYPQPQPNHALSLPGTTVAGPTIPANQDVQRPMDTSGQVNPPNHRPKVTATVWEDEGTICFQVEAGGICVARRQDNHMINGTKLLNVAQMTRGRRDGILKSEKQRKVIKIGPMHLKGVWIPYERALEFANKEKITESLYPLFIHNIAHLLNQAGLSPTAAGLPSQNRDQPTRDANQSVQRSSQPPSTSQQKLIGAPPASSPSNGTSQTATASNHRPSLERAHTLPTPPNPTDRPVHATSSYETPASSNILPSSSHHHIAQFPDSKSLPTTPASTPPDNAVAGIQQQYAPLNYDGARHDSGVTSNPSSTYGVPTNYGYAKTDMGPPQKMSKNEESDIHSQSGYEHDRVYSGYQTHHTLPSSVNLESKNTPSASGQSPHSTGSSTNQWSSAYTTPQRNSHPLPSSFFYNGQPNNATTNGYHVPSQNYGYPTPAQTSNKRGRDDDDDGGAYDASNALKRRRTGVEDASANQAHIRTGPLRH